MTETNGGTRASVRWLMGLVAVAFMFLVGATYSSIMHRLDKLEEFQMGRSDRIALLEGRMGNLERQVAEVHDDVKAVLGHQTSIEENTAGNGDLEGQIAGIRNAVRKLAAMQRPAAPRVPPAERPPPPRRRAAFTPGEDW